MSTSVKLYKDAERLIEDFFQNFELHIAPREGCDEVAVQRVKETLANYLEFTGDETQVLERSELESVFRAALTDFLYEVYFTLDDDSPAATSHKGKSDGDPFGADDDEAFEKELRALEKSDDAAIVDDASEASGVLGDDVDDEDDDDEEEDDREFYAILTLHEIVGLLRESPDAYADCNCLAEKALLAAEEGGTRAVVATLESLAGELRARRLNTEVRKVLADCYFALGEVHHAAGEPAHAIAAYKQAARVHGHFPAAYARLAAAHFEANDLSAALEAWSHQLALTPDDPEPYLAAAKACEGHGKAERAIELLTSMLTIDRENAAALDMLVRLSQEEGRIPEAQSWRERILKMRPPRRLEDLTVWVKHHVDASNFDAILDHLHREELDAPSHAVLNLLKAMVFLAKEDPDNAEVELLVLRDKQNGTAHASDLESHLSSLERIFGSPRIDPLRRAIAEHVI